MSTFNSDEEAYANESFECDSDEINDSPAPNITNRESLQLKLNTNNDRYDLKYKQHSRQSLSCRPRINGVKLSDDEDDSDSDDVIMGNEKLLSIDTYSMNFDGDLSDRPQILTPIRPKYSSSRGRLQNRKGNEANKDEEDNENGEDVVDGISDYDEEDDEDDEEEYERIEHVARLYQENMRLSANRNFQNKDKIAVAENMALLNEGKKDDVNDKDSDDVDEEDDEKVDEGTMNSERSDEIPLEINSQCSDNRHVEATAENPLDEDNDVEDQFSDEDTDIEDSDHDAPNSDYETADEAVLDGRATNRHETREFRKISRQRQEVGDGKDESNDEKEEDNYNTLNNSIDEENSIKLKSKSLLQSEIETENNSQDVYSKKIENGQSSHSFPAMSTSVLNQSKEDLFSKEMENNLQSNITNILQQSLMNLKTSDKEIKLTNDMLGPSTLDETFKKLNLGVSNTAELAKTMIKAVKSQVLKEREKLSRIDTATESDLQQKEPQMTEDSHDVISVTLDSTELQNVEDNESQYSEFVCHSVNDGAGDSVYEDFYSEFDDGPINEYGYHSYNYRMDSRTPSYVDSEEYLCQPKFLTRASNVRKTRSNEESLKIKPHPRKSMSFTNERMREIERHNRILLNKIISQKPTYSLKPTQQLKKKSSEPVKNRPSSAAINRKKQQRQIDQENLILKRKLEAISVRRTSLYF